jgi:hypothetical protein
MTRVLRCHDTFCVDKDEHCLQWTFFAKAHVVTHGGKNNSSFPFDCRSQWVGGWGNSQKEKAFSQSFCLYGSRGKDHTDGATAVSGAGDTRLSKPDTTRQSDLIRDLKSLFGMKRHRYPRSQVGHDVSSGDIQSR